MGNGIDDKIKIYFNSNNINIKHIDGLKDRIKNLVIRHPENIDQYSMEIFLAEDYSPSRDSISLDNTILHITSFFSKKDIPSIYKNDDVKNFGYNTYILKLSIKKKICSYLKFDDKEITDKLTELTKNNNSDNAFLINQDGRYVGFLLCYQS